MGVIKNDGDDLTRNIKNHELSDEKTWLWKIVGKLQLIKVSYLKLWITKNT